MKSRPLETAQADVSTAPRRRIRPAAALAVALALVALPAPSSAQEAPAPDEGSGANPAAKERSRKLFDEGRALVEQNRWADACPLFEAAHAANATGGTALQLARCFEMINQGARAIPFYQYILDNRATQPEARVAIAETRIAALKREQASKAPEDGPKPPEQDASKDAPKSGGDAGPAGSTPDAAPPPPRPAPAPSRAPAFVALGIGGAGLVVGGVFGGIALSKAGEANEQCGPTPGRCVTSDFDRTQTLRDDATTMAWVSNVGLAVGVVGVAVGVVLLVTQKSPEQTGLSIPTGSRRALRVTPTANGLRTSF